MCMPETRKMMKLYILMQVLALANAHYDYISDNEISDYDSPSAQSHNLERQIKKCFENESTMRCLKLAILNSKISAESERRIIKVKEDDQDNDDFRLKLPQYIFNGAEVSYRSGRGYALDFPEAAVEEREGRRIHRRRKKFLMKLILFKFLLVPALVGITALALYSGTGLMFPLFLGSIAAFFYKEAIMSAVAKYMKPKRPADDDDDDDDQKFPNIDDESDDEDTTGMPDKSPSNHSRDPTTLAYIAYTPSKPVETTQKPGSLGASITSLPSFSSLSPNSVGSTKTSASEESSSSVGSTKSPAFEASSVASSAPSSGMLLLEETTLNPSSQGPTLTTARLISTPKS